MLSLIAETALEPRFNSFSWLDSYTFDESVWRAFLVYSSVSSTKLPIVQLLLNIFSMMIDSSPRRKTKALPLSFQFLTSWRTWSRRWRTTTPPTGEPRSSWRWWRTASLCRSHKTSPCSWQLRERSGIL